jgi:hypothetical protein
VSTIKIVKYATKQIVFDHDWYPPSPFRPIENSLPEFRLPIAPTRFGMCCPCCENNSWAFTFYQEFWNAVQLQALADCSIQNFLDRRRQPSYTEAVESGLLSQSCPERLL